MIKTEIVLGFREYNKIKSNCFTFLHFLVQSDFFFFSFKVREANVLKHAAFVSYLNYDLLSKPLMFWTQKLIWFVARQKQ